LILSAFTSTTTFSNAGVENTSYVIQIFVGVSCALMGILSSLQNYFLFNEKSGVHRKISIQYMKLKEEFEVFITMYKSGINESTIEDFIKSIIVKMNKLDDDSPNLPIDLYERHIGRYKKNISSEIAGIKIMIDTPEFENVEIKEDKINNV
jgi:hypothetical protein